VNTYPDSNYPLLWNLGAQNGVNFYLRGRDKVHFIPANSNCSGGGIVPEADFTTTGLPFDSQIRRALGVPPPPPPPPQQQTTPAPVTPSQTTPTTQPTTPTPPSLDQFNTTPFPPGTCAPQTYCAQQDGNIYFRASTCVDQRYQTCPTGCTGFTCNSTSTNANLSPFDRSLGSEDTGSSDTENGHSTSTFDLIDFFANPPVDVGTATPIDISGPLRDVSNASVLGPNGQPVAQQNQGYSQQYGPVPQQTFTSNDLANSPIGQRFMQGTLSQQILSQMRATLLNMLNYLKPFGTLQTQAVYVD
jgi:hypothetical protein